MRESGKDAMGNPEKKILPNFTSGSSLKRAKGKTLWNKEGMRYLKNAEKTWTKIYDSEEDMKVLYNGWEEWIVSTGKEIAVDDGTKKTFHYIMGSWYDEETPESKEKIDESEEDDTFGNDDGYSSDRGRSRHSGAWKTGQLRDKRMKGGKWGENQKHSDESVDSEEKREQILKLLTGHLRHCSACRRRVLEGRRQQVVKAPQEIPGWLVGKRRWWRRGIKREGRHRDDDSVCFSG